MFSAAVLSVDQDGYYDVWSK